MLAGYIDREHNSGLAEPNRLGLVVLPLETHESYIATSIILVVPTYE